jgi:hypothetical protein
VDGRFDEDWIRQPVLAEKFLTEDGSKLRTSLPVIHWLEKHYGAPAINNLLRALRIPNDAIRDPERPVKLKLLCMLLRSASARGVSKQSIFEIGLGAVNIRENQSIRKTLEDFRSPKDAYEFFFGGQGLVERFEKNYRYRIEKMTDDSVVLSTRPFESRILENGADVVHDHLISTYRWGVAAGVLGVVGNPIASVTPVRVAEKAGDSEQFRITWASKRNQAACADVRPALRLL